MANRRDDHTVSGMVKSTDESDINKINFSPFFC